MKLGDWGPPYLIKQSAKPKTANSVCSFTETGLTGLSVVSIFRTVTA